MKKQNIIVVISLFIILIFITVGLSYAAFSYIKIGQTINQITTGTISMEYMESDNIISITNALPTSDETGKLRLKEKEYFDFSITTTLKGNAVINWEIAAQDLEDNTFDGTNVKFYLTKLVGSEEEVVNDNLPAVYNEQKVENKQTGRPANMMSLLIGSTSTQEKKTTNYRLRLYVDENYNPQGDGGNLVFKARVNVYGKVAIWHQIKTEDNITIKKEATVGETIHFEVEEKEGYTYNGAEVINSNGKVIDTIEKNKKEFIMPDEEISIKIKWKPINYEISNQQTIGGNINIPSNADYKSMVTITADPDDGYTYDGLIITDKDDKVLLTLPKDETNFKMPLGNIRVTAKWEKINYTISKVDGIGGSITIAKTATVGDIIDFTTKADIGYAYNGAIINSNGQTMTNLTSDQTTFTMPANNIVITSKWQLLPTIRAFSTSDTYAFHSSAYKENITSVIFKNNTMLPSTAIVNWDVSATGNNSVIAYIENDGAGGYKLTIGGQGGVAANSDSGHLFRGFSKVTSMDFTHFNTSRATDMTELFRGCKVLSSLDLSNFDTSNVTNMSYMFLQCKNLTNLNLSSFDTSNVTTMSKMFDGCSILTSVDIRSFNTIKVTNMSYMFYYCNNLKTILVSSKWTMENVNNQSGMYTNCPGRPQVV